jgi:predicted transcriptional regulator of viral defense system
MYRLEKLSGLEQKLYFLLEAENKRMANSETAMKLLKISRMHAYNLLKNMYEKGALDKVRSNLYVRIPAHIVHDRGKYVEDPVLVAAYLTKPYFLSYYTALGLHGLSQQYSTRYYVSTIKQVNHLNYHGNVIYLVILSKKRFFGYEEIDYREEKIMVSDLERTIVDVLNRPEYAGGFEEILRCLIDVQKMDWDKLLGYIDRMGEKILVNRAGFIFELLKDQVKTPESFLKKLQAELSKNIYYFEKQKKGKFNEKWKIVVDPRFEKAVQGV